MPKDTNEKELIANNLKYIGLDLEKIPEFLLEYKDVDFKPSKTYEENTFKVYRHIHLNDIQILLTPKNRLNTTIEKYSEAEPLAQYLDTENEENIIKYANFFLYFFTFVSISQLFFIVQEKLYKFILFSLFFSFFMIE